MDLFYGTYLTYRIQQTIQQAETALSVKEIETSIHLYPDPRERYNFRSRIRQSLQYLCHQGILEREEVKGDNNLIFHKYAIHANYQCQTNTE